MFNLREYLNQKNLSFDENKKGYLILKECPFCGGNKKMYLKEPDDKHNLGFINCFKCEIKPNNLTTLIMNIESVDFKGALSIINEGQDPEEIKKYKAQKELNALLNLEIQSEIVEEQDDTLSFILNATSIVLPDVDFSDFPKEGIEYILSRGLNIEDIKRLGILIIPEEVRELANKIINSVQDREVRNIIFEYAKNKKDYDGTNIDVMWVNMQLNQLYKLRGRAVFPVNVGKKTVGYVARDWTKKSNIKVLNSEGQLTSDYFWNFNGVLKSKKLIVAEGIFSAISCGLDRSIAILGKSISQDSNKLNLIGSLKNSAEEVVIFLDPGAYPSAVKIAELFIQKFDLVKIVKVPTVLNMNPVGINIDLLLEGGLSASSDGTNLYMSYYDHKICKLVKKAAEFYFAKDTAKEKNIINIVDQMKDSNPNARRRFYQCYSKAKNNPDLLKEVKKIAISDFLDANDFGKIVCNQLIDEAIVYSEYYDFVNLDNLIVKMPKKEAA